MKILYIGKYLETKGGEVSNAYWLLKGLSKLGHTIVVLTDSSIIPMQYKCENFVDSLEYHDITFDKVKDYCINLNRIHDFDLVLGWYIYPYCKIAIEIANLLNIPSVCQHAGSDLKKLETDYNTRLLLNHADLFLYYRKCEYIKKLIQCKSFAEHTPSLANEYFIKKINSSNKILILGSKNKSKCYDKLKHLFLQIPEYEFNWYGYGVIEKINNFNSLGIIPCYDIPELISNYSAVVYAEENFNNPYHISKIPLESIANGKLVIMSDNIINLYKEYQHFIVPFKIEDVNTLKNAIHQIKNQDRIQSLSNFLDNEFDDEIYHEYIESLLLNLVDS